MNLIENTNCPQMKELLNLAQQIKDSDISVLITGETGTGKELMADYIQSQSTLFDKAYNKINCAAIPDTLIESEFFGHLKGAFTGAGSEKVGIFEQSKDGTIFLDEIGDMSEAAQSKILRVLQEKRVKKVGSIKEYFVNFRIISATNKNLYASDSFRKDLLYRINGIIFDLPPLRERVCDIDLLCDYFVKKFSNKLNRNEPKINSNTRFLLNKYNWPGNIRELENVIKRSVAVSNGTLDVRLESNHLKNSKLINSDSINFNNYGLKMSEYELILAALSKAEYSQKKAAVLLKITPRALNYKIAAYKITHPNWKKNV